MFNPGDLVTVVNNKTGHPFGIGTTIAIFRKCCDGYKACLEEIAEEDRATNWWYVDDKDVEERNG